jgi:hypothetical protein
MLTSTPRRCPTWQDLVRLSDNQLGVIDIALVNLACAIDLPGRIQPDLDLLSWPIIAPVQWLGLSKSV